MLISLSQTSHLQVPPAQMLPAGTVHSSSVQHVVGEGLQPTVGGMVAAGTNGAGVGKGEGALEGIGLGKTDGELLGCNDGEEEG